MKGRSIARFVLAGMLLAAWAALLPAAAQAKKPVKHNSPPYTVMVALQAYSPYVADGRMSIADLAFSATFKDVVFSVDLKAGRTPFFVERHDGRLSLTRHLFNDVCEGDDRHSPWVKQEWPVEFPASLVEGWIEKEEEPDPKWKADDMTLEPLVPEKIKLGFYARFGLMDLMWFSKLGSCTLSNMLFEFAVPWEPLLDGKPLTLKLPYEGGYPEDKGEWWIEFIPRKK